MKKLLIFIILIISLFGYNIQANATLIDTNVTMYDVVIGGGNIAYYKGSDHFIYSYNIDTEVITLLYNDTTTTNINNIDNGIIGILIGYGEYIFYNTNNNTFIYKDIYTDYGYRPTKAPYVIGDMSYAVSDSGVIEYNYITDTFNLIFGCDVGYSEGILKDEYFYYQGKTDQTRLVRCNIDDGTWVNIYDTDIKPLMLKLYGNKIYFGDLADANYFYSYNIDTTEVLTEYVTTVSSYNFDFYNSGIVYSNTSDSWNLHLDDGITPPPIEPPVDPFGYFTSGYTYHDSGFAYHNFIPDNEYWGGTLVFEITQPDENIIITNSYDSTEYGFDYAITVEYPYHQTIGTYSAVPIYTFEGENYILEGSLPYEITVPESPFTVEDLDPAMFDLCDENLDGFIDTGEQLTCAWRTVSTFFSKVYDILANIKTLFVKLMSIGTDDVKDFSFISTSYASVSSDILPSKVPNQDNFLSKMEGFLKGFLFLVFIIIILVMILALKKD